MSVMNTSEVNAPAPQNASRLSQLQPSRYTSPNTMTADWIWLSIANSSQRLQYFCPSVI